MRKSLIFFLCILALAGCASQGGGNQAGRPQAGPASSPLPNVNGSQRVVGINGVQGEIIGTTAPGSKFNRVQIGMGLKQVQDIIGVPEDNATHITGKAFIPFYFGGDTHMVELFYKGNGQLSFVPTALGSGVDVLVRIINDPSETGYAH